MREPYKEVPHGEDCAAVRSAISDDGRPPLDASGLKLHGRLVSIAQSLRRVKRQRKKGKRTTS